MTQEINQQIAMRVSKITILWNILLSVFKCSAGILASSSAMVSDALHSASDVFSTVIVMVGVKISSKEADREHPYGHERMECVAALLLAVILFATGIGIGISGIRKVFSGSGQTLAAPKQLALAAAAISIAVKEAMYWYTMAAAKKINSGAFMADAWHHRSDALSSVGSFIGILGARMGFPILDPIASVVICMFIIKASITIFIDSINKMTDHSCDNETYMDISRLITAEDGVLGIDQVNTRLFGNRIYVDVEISVLGELSLNEVHEIAHRVHDSIEHSVPRVKHCMVHVNPGSQK